MRLLLCNWRDIKHPLAGGAEVYTHRILQQWAAQGHQVTQFSAAVPGQADRTELDGIEMIRGGGGRLGVYEAARHWYEREGQGLFDLIIDEVNTCPFFCHEWAGDTPTVALIHQVAREVWFSEFTWPLAAVGRWWLEPRWLARYRYVPTLTISESSAGSLREYGLQRVVVAPVGIDPPPPIDVTAKEQAPTVLFVGRLAANKRPDHAVKAFSTLLNSYPEAQLWVVGSGAMAEELEEAASPNVRFFGRVSNQLKYELMARAHVLAVTSVREGWGLVVDEAASVGTPSIGYDVDGLRDSVAATTGTLVAPHPQALGEALARHFDSIGAEPIIHLIPHAAIGWKQVADKILDLISDMLLIDLRSEADSSAVVRA
jgi:glycosyltransferase involved in cell wall biosynthesis